MLSYHILVFIVSCFVLFWFGKRLIESLIKIARFLRWREFVVAFFAVAFATSLPNLLVGLNAAFQKIPELSFGEIIGGNMADLTLALSLAVLFSGGSLETNSRMVQGSTIFTAAAAILPVILVLDGDLSRADGVILILFFLFYVSWLFSKEEKFRKVYNGAEEHLPLPASFKNFLKNVIEVIISVVLLILASQGVVKSAVAFSGVFSLPLVTVGILIVGLGNAFPEIYFSIISARKNQNWLILGELMGSVIICATLVLGIVVLITPFKIDNFSPFLVARMFLIIAVLFFFLFIKTGRKITKKEGIALFLLYLLFVLAEILIK